MIYAIIKMLQRYVHIWFICSIHTHYYNVIINTAEWFVTIPKVWDGGCFAVNWRILEIKMKKIFSVAAILLFLTTALTGCGMGEKNVSISIIYASVTVLSLLLLVGCVFSVRKKRFWFIMLFSSVFVVNAGYTLLSVSSCLDTALWANRISYLGSVFLPMSMLMILLNVTDTKYKKHLPHILFSVAGIIFLIAATPGILPIYYKDVSFEVVGGVSTLVKVYGPLHPLYLVYLLGYFFAMVAVIFRARVKKTLDNASHAVFLAMAVFVNIGVWFIEQLVSIDFEMLSVSYIISELFLLGVHLVMNENQRLRMIVKQVETARSYSNGESQSEIMLEKPIEGDSVSPESVEMFMQGLSTLTPTEREIYQAYVARVTTKEVMASMNIKESTLKYHNRNIYSKLGVSTRKELLELHKHVKGIKENLEALEKNK